MTNPDFPGTPRPPGTLGVGLFRDLQLKTVDDAKSVMSGGVMGAFEHTQDTLHEEYNVPLDNVRIQAVDAITQAELAVEASEAAANDAAAAVETADLAYENASYWETECVVASAEVLLGVNELLIGLCQNVPDGRTRAITDIHIALLDQPGGMTIQTKKWNAAGTSSTVIHTATLIANQTRFSQGSLGIGVADKERIFWNVSAITGSVAPTVLQILVFGVIY